MSVRGGRELQFLRTVIQCSALVTALLALAGLLGWFLARPMLSSFGVGLIPMAPSTAISFLLLGAVLALFARHPEKAAVRRAAAVGAGCCLLVTVFLFILASHGVYLSIERLGVTPIEAVDGAPTGHMSPLTAILFVAVCAALLVLLSASAARPGRILVALCLTALVLLASYALILAYLFGWPLLYGGRFIPPALPTSLAFGGLGVALLASVRLQAAPRTARLDGLNIRESYALFGIFAVLALGIVAGGFLYYKKTEHEHLLAVERQLSAIADLKVNDIAQWREERLGDGQTFCRNAAFHELAQRYFDNPDDDGVRNRLYDWLHQVQKSYHYEYVLLLDGHCVERISVPDTPQRPKAQDLAEIRAILERGEVAFWDFHRDSGQDPVHLSVVAPLFDAGNGGPPIGAVVLVVDPEHYLYPFINRWPVPSETAETLLVRREGNDVLFLNELRFQAGAALSLRKPLSDRSLPAARAAMGYEGVVEGWDYRGVRVLAVTRTIPDSPWALVARMDRSEVNAPMKARLWETGLFVLVLVSCAATGIALAWRQKRVQYFRERYNSERERAWLHDIISRSLNEIYVFDPDTLLFTFANTGACRNIGYTIDELVRLTPVDIKPDFTLDSFRASLQPLLGGETGLTVFETVHRRKDGTLYPVEAHLQYLETAGKPVFLAIISDITERKRAETAIRRLNRVYAVLSDINQAIVRTDDVQLLFEASCRIAVEKGEFPLVWIGMLDESNSELRPVASAGEFGGYLEKVRLSLHEETRPDCPIDVTLRSGRPTVCNHIDQDEHSAPCQLNALRFGFRACASFPLRVSGAVRGVIAFYASESMFFDDDELKLLDELSMDISFAMEFAEREAARTRAESALQDSVARYQHLVDSSPMAIFINRNGRIDYINPAGIALFGAASADQIVGKASIDLFHTDYHETVRDRIRQLHQDRGSVPLIEEKIVRLDGATRDVEVAASLFTDRDGDAIQVVLNDITDRKSLEAQLNHARKMEAIGQLAGGVAHDFNNVLQAIMGSTHLLADSPETTAQQRELIAEVQASADRAATLTRQLLAFSRRQVMRPEVLDLNGAIGDLLKMLRRVIGEHVRLDFLQGSHLGAIYADRGMIEQVIMNLCVNARDAMPGGGILTIETENVRIDSEYCAAHAWAKVGRYVLLSVTDTGCGMDTATIEHIFEPFFTTKEEGKGTGLGLATVYGIVKQHDGMISAYSEPDKGTTFKVYLPLCERSAEAVGTKIEGLATGGTETILLAEDDEAVRRLAERILSRAGYTVLSATDGEEAVALFKEQTGRIDLLVFDVVMPNMGGHEAYERIHALRPGLPVLFSSGYSENAVHTNFVLHEGLDLIQKPYARDELLRAVRRALEKTRRT